MRSAAARQAQTSRRTASRLRRPAQQPRRALLRPRSRPCLCRLPPATTLPPKRDRQPRQQHRRATDPARPAPPQEVSAACGESESERFFPLPLALSEAAVDGGCADRQMCGPPEVLNVGRVDRRLRELPDVWGSWAKVGQGRLLLRMLLAVCRIACTRESYARVNACMETY